MKTQMIGTSLNLFLALVEFKGWLFSYLDNSMGMKFIGESMQKGKKDRRD